MERVFCMIPEKNGKKGGARRYLKPYHLMPTKNSKGRSLTPAPYVMGLLRRQRAQQAERRLKAGGSWQNTNLVFTDELDTHLKIPTVYHNFKRIASSIGLPDLRLHDLRHSYTAFPTGKGKFSHKHGNPLENTGGQGIPMELP